MARKGTVDPLVPAFQWFPRTPADPISSEPQTRGVTIRVRERLYGCLERAARRHARGYAPTGSRGSVPTPRTLPAATDASAQAAEDQQCAQSPTRFYISRGRTPVGAVFSLVSCPWSLVSYPCLSSLFSERNAAASNRPRPRLKRPRTRSRDDARHGERKCTARALSRGRFHGEKSREKDGSFRTAPV